MKVIKQEAVILKQSDGLEGLYKQIEYAARTCYQSYDKATTGSGERMVNWLAEHKHTAMLEHGTVYLKGTLKELEHYIVNPYSKVHKNDDILYITTNYRVIIENGWKNDLKYMCSPTEYHEKRYTVKAITNLQVSTELLRHRKMSFAMESSRYCSYDKEKFGDELTFILPSWLDDKAKKMDVIEWANGMQDAENHYMRLIHNGWTAEKAAQFLPKAAKTTIVMTGFESDWDHFFDLRYFEKTGEVHPQMKELSTIIYNLFEK